MPLSCRCSAAWGAERFRWRDPVHRGQPRRGCPQPAPRRPKAAASSTSEKSARAWTTPRRARGCGWSADET